jgi:hypothetical protein
LSLLALPAFGGVLNLKKKYLPAEAMLPTEKHFLREKEADIIFNYLHLRFQHFSSF